MEQLMSGGGASAQRRKSIKTYREIVEDKYDLTSSLSGSTSCLHLYPTLIRVYFKCSRVCYY